MKKQASATLAVMLAMTLVVGPVQPASAASVQLSATKITLKVGQTKTLKLKKATGKVTWTSSKKAVATVSSKGIKNVLLYIESQFFLR